MIIELADVESDGWFEVSLKNATLNTHTMLSRFRYVELDSRDRVFSTPAMRNQAFSTAKDYAERMSISLSKNFNITDKG